MSIPHPYYPELSDEAKETYRVLWALVNEAATAATMTNYHAEQYERWAKAHKALSEIEQQFRDETEIPGYYSSTGVDIDG